MKEQQKNKRKKKKPMQSASAGSQGKKRFQRHFRKVYNSRFTGHPTYVYDESGNKYKVLGITSSPETGGVKNVLLERNPEPGNQKSAYVRPMPMQENKGAFGERLKGWKFAENDKNKVRKITDKDNRQKKT